MIGFQNIKTNDQGALTTVLFAVAMAYDTTILATCSSCPTGCLACSGSACSSCRTGYELVTATSSCTPYPCSVSGCSLCNAAGQCLSCTDPYSLYSSFSNSCISSCHLSHCQKCKAGSLACEQCQSGYSLYSWDGSCQSTQIQNCLRVHDWRNTQFQCDSCTSGYRPTPDQLQCMASTCPSLPNCLTCSANTSVCQSCRPGYTVSNSACELNSCIVSNCLYCSAAPATCLKCAYGYQLSGSACVQQSCGMENCQKCKKGSIFCDLCQDQYVYNVWTHVCEEVETTPQPQNCQSMMRNGRYFKCISCKSGYVFADSNQVKCIQQCPSNCVACSSATTCTNCSIGYAVVGGSCVALLCSVPGCSLCNSTGGCISCSDPYSLFLSSLGACSPSCVLPHCETCLSGSSTCQKCLQGYALSSWNNTCSLSLISHCVQFHDWPGRDFFCSRCSLGYKPSSDQLSCIQISCLTISNCEYCPNSTICSTCSPGYSVAANGLSCTVNPCGVQNCLLCNSAGQCVKSNSAHYIVGNSMYLITCTLPGCSRCKLGSFYCQQCSTGYQLNIWTNQCDGAAPEGGSQLKYLWFLVIAVVIVAVVIIVKCLKKNNEVTLEEEPAVGDTSGHHMPNEDRVSLKDEIREGGELFGTSVSALQVGQFPKPPSKQRQKLPPLALPSQSKEAIRQSSAQLSSPSPVINLQRQQLVEDPGQSIN